MKKHRRFLMALCVLTLIMLALAGCNSGGDSTPATPATPAPSTATPAPAANDTVYTFKMHHHQNPGSCGDEVANQWVQLVEDNAGGQVDITVYGAQTIGKAVDAWDMVVNNVVDISWGFIPNFAGQFPITEGVSLPLMGLNSAVQGSQVLQAMFESNADMQQEYQDVHVLFFHTHDPGWIGLNKSASASSSLNGRQIRVQGDGQTKMIQALGASAVPVTLPDLYEAMEKGVVEGYALGMEGITSFKLYEVTSSLLNCRYYEGAFWVVMNKAKWDSLPANVQEAFTKASGMAGAELFGGAWDKAAAAGLKTCTDNGVKVIELTAEESATWQELAVGVQQTWANNLSSSGLDGSAILDQYKALVEQYSH